jgi:hypothetical protein
MGQHHPMGAHGTQDITPAVEIEHHDGGVGTWRGDPFRRHASGAYPFCQDVVVHRHRRQHCFIGHPILLKALAWSRGTRAYQADDAV